MPDNATIRVRDRHGFEKSVPARAGMVMGRQAGCDLVLADSMVSRAHLRLDLDGDGWWVEDLGSSHGTFHRDERLERRRWEPGEVLRVADGAYFLTLAGEAGSSACEVNLHAILQTAALLACDVELDELLERTLDQLLAVSGTTRGFIMLPEEGRLAVRARRNLGEPGSALADSIQLSMSSVAQVFDRGEPVWVRNVSADQEVRDRDSVSGLRLATILCLPMQVQGERIGVLYLDSPRAITRPIDRATFEAMVALCASAVERTRLAEENLRNQVLATVGKVASAIVHDFKNGLFVIAGHAQLLGMTAADGSTRHHLAQILGATDRLGQLSLDILDYSKVREPRREPVELAAFLAGQVEPLQPRAQEMEVELTCRGPECRIDLDRHRFSRVVENLLAHALDALAGRDGGRVALTWEPVDGGGVTIRVADNGRGIPPKVQKRIFEPFYSWGKARGTGLGMATVGRIVAEHGGAVEVASEEGQGTTITVRLPGTGGPGPDGGRP